jgi:hypothetical protein
VGNFSSVSSRSLVAPGRGLRGVPLSAPWWRVLVGSALSAGALRWRLRASPRSFSGVVVVVGFASPAAASAFALTWSGWVGVAVAVRRFSCASGTVWGVSVPVAAPPSSVCAGALPSRLPSPAWVRGV